MSKTISTDTARDHGMSRVFMPAVWSLDRLQYVDMALISRSGLELSTVHCVLPRGVFPMLYRHEPLATEYLDISLCELRSVNTRYLDIHTPGSFHTSAQFAVTVRFLASDVCRITPPLPRTSGCHHNKVSPPPPLHTDSVTVELQTNLREVSQTQRRL